MSKPKPIEYANASPEVRAVFDDIKTSRNVPDVNNFWKYLANDPKTLKRTWESVKEIMAPGALDPLVKEMLYVAVSVTNGCGYCIASHGAAAEKAGMTPENCHLAAQGARDRGQPWKVTDSLSSSKTTKALRGPCGDHSSGVATAY